MPAWRGQGAFDFSDVLKTLTEKLVRRHPHVFGEPQGLTPSAVESLWEDIKRQERTQRRGRQTDAGQEGALAGIPVGLPALTRALKLQVKAGTVGFDWNDPLAVLAKIREEANEIEAEVANGDLVAAQAEVGDLLFAVVNLARHLGADPEPRCAAAIRNSNAGSGQSSELSRQAARPLCRPRWQKWKTSGMRPRRQSERRARAVDQNREREACASVVSYHCSASGAQILQIHEPAGFRQGRLQRTRLAHHRDDAGEPSRSISPRFGRTPRSGSKQRQRLPRDRFRRARVLHDDASDMIAIDRIAYEL